MAYLLGCQVCLSRFSLIGEFKKHVKSKPHVEKMKEVFQTDHLANSGVIPSIVVFEQLNKQRKTPIIGLSQMTLCFGLRTNTCFYLCHVCEEKCSSDRIANHLFSVDHHTNYFSYTDPDKLSFCWIPSMDKDLIEKLTTEANNRGPGQLQFLDLPLNLLEKLATRQYSEVMSCLSENNKLLKTFEAVMPKRAMIQTYQRDSSRKHPLLGMQHIVECISAGLTEKRHYLCTLCQLPMGVHMIIKHVLSFDHIYCYFRAWHPSTLLSRECYLEYTNSLVSMILNFAKQTEEIHTTENTDMKQVSLEPDTFRSVNFTCYAEALKKMESITKERNKESSLIADIRPGDKLDRSVSAASAVLPYKLRCQNCSLIVGTIRQYSNHVSAPRHKKALGKCFGTVESAHGYFQKGLWMTHLGLHAYIKNSWEQNEPAIGVSLVVIIVCTKDSVNPFYLCFACEETFPESSFRQHFNSHKHLINTLLYQNPWRLPFAWTNSLDVQFLKSMAWEEEKERGSHQMLLKMFDVPRRLLRNLLQDPSSPKPYPNVMAGLNLYHTLLRREVPGRETYSKLEQNERFPLLGEQFLVMHSTTVSEMGFLCLLCERRLINSDFYAHVFSREHVATFLDRFHPGSLSSTFDTDAIILDLAKQAARIHPISHVQVIDLMRPIFEPSSYSKVIFVLQSTKKSSGKGSLKPPINPKMKLVPRDFQKKDMEKGDVRENSRRKEGSEKQTSHKSIDDNGMTLENISVEACAEITTTFACGAESGENVKMGTVQEMPTPSEKEAKRGQEKTNSKTDSEDIKNAGSETYQVIKEKKIEEPSVKNPNEESLECCQNTGKVAEAEVAQESSKSSEDGQKQLKNNIYKETERSSSISMSERSGKKKGHKRQLLNSKEDSSAAEQKNLPSIKQKEEITTEEGEGSKPSHETANEEATCNMNHQGAQLWQYIKIKSRAPVIGLCSLLECHCDQLDPVYLCECCSLMIPEKDIISHVTGADHQRTYLVGSQKLPPGKDINSLAARFEQDNGYGTAQVVDLDKEMYNNIFKQSPKSAIQAVKALVDQQNSWHGLPPTSALSAVQSVDSSVALHTRQDDDQVEDMEIDDPEDIEAQPSSLTTALPAMTETTEVRPESNEDVKMTQIKVSESACNVKTCLTVSRTSEDSYVSTSETNATRLQLDSTGNALKAEIISNTTEGPLKTDAASKIVRTSQYVATANSAAAKSAKSVTAISKCQARSPSSTLDTTKSAVVTSNRTKTTPTTSTSRETAYKSIATTSNVAIITTKLTGDNPVSSAASKIDKALTHSEAATSVVCENTEVSPMTAHVKNSVGQNAAVGPNVPKNKSPATVLESVRSENQKPSTQPSHTSTSKTKQSESPPKVGVNHLIAVTCGHKQQVYCRLCTVRLTGSGHLRDFSHKYNYVKMMCPGWAAPPSQLDRFEKIVARLAEIEKDIGPPIMQKMEVNIDVYNELRKLPEDTALERLKEMLRQRDLCNSSPTDIREVAFTSPCEASSPDDGMSVPQNEMTRLYTDNKLKQENKSKLQTPLDQVPEIESVSKAERNPSVGQSDRVQSLKSSEPEATDPTSAHKTLCPTLKENKPEPFVSPRIQDADTAANAKQEIFESYMESQARVEVTPATHSRAGKMDRIDGWTDPPVTSSEVTVRPAQIFDTSQEAAEMRHRKRRRPEPQESKKVLEGSRKTLPIIPLNRDAHPSGSSVNTEPQNQSSPNQEAEHVPKHSGCSPGPGILGASQAFSGTLVGQRTQGPSRLSTFLSVQGLENQPIIGLGCVWECRGIGLDSFFLCESCSITLSIKYIHGHMISTRHQYNYLRTKEFLQFMSKDLLPFMKMNIFNFAIQALSEQERSNKKDAQVILLRPDSYEYVRTVPFSEALKMVKTINQQPNQSVSSTPVSPVQQNDKQPEDQQNREEYLNTEKQPTQTLETDQKATHKTEKLGREETANEDKQRRVGSPVVVNSVSSKADPLPSADICLTPQETSGSLTEKPEMSPPASRHLSPIPELQVKPGGGHSESPSSSIVRHDASQTLSVSLRHECPPSRKRPATSSLETLVTPDTSNPQPNQLLPTKQACSSLQAFSHFSMESTSGSTSVSPAVTSTSLPQKDEGIGLKSEQDSSIVNWERRACLNAASRERERNMSMSIPCSGNATTYCAECSSEKVVERGWGSKHAQTTSAVTGKPTRWDSKSPVFKATVKIASPAAPVVSKPTADPQNQSVDTQSMCGNVSLLKASPASHNPGQIPQPQAHIETHSTGNHQLPVHSIITPRSDHANQHFMVTGYGLDHAEANRGYQFAHSFSTGAAVTPGDAFAGSGNYVPYGQMASSTNGQLPGYLPPESVACHRTPENPCIYTGNVYQCKEYTPRAFYPSQIYPEQEACRFARSLENPTPPACVGLEMQQQLMQQYYSSQTNAALAAGGGIVTNQAVYLGVVPFSAPANTSQRCTNLNDYTANAAAPTQSSNIMTHGDDFSVRLNIAVAHYLPADNVKSHPWPH